MPIYAYACKECDHTLDALQKIADARLGIVRIVASRR